MREPTPVGPEDAAAFLAEHFDRGHVDVEHLGEGMWSRAFGFEHDDRELVVRFGRHRDDYEKDQRAGGFTSGVLPVPAVVEIGAAFDGYFAISTRARGAPLEELDEAGWRTTLPALFAALDAMRAVDVSHTAGFGGWDGRGHAPHETWRGFLLAVAADTPDRRTHGWRSLLARSVVGDGPFAEGLACLTEVSVDLPPFRHVVHADLINRNVLVADGQLGAVLDWGCSSYGDPLYDIAWLEHWAPWHPGLAAIDIRAEARRHHELLGLDTTDFDRRLRCCALHIGLDHQAYDAWLQDAEALVAVVERTRHYIDDGRGDGRRSLVGV